MKNMIKTDSLPELINNVEKATKQLRTEIRLLKRHVQNLKVYK